MSNLPTAMSQLTPVDLYLGPDAARILGISTQTLREWTRRGLARPFRRVTATQVWWSPRELAIIARAIQLRNEILWDLRRGVVYARMEWGESEEQALEGIERDEERQRRQQAVAKEKVAREGRKTCKGSGYKATQIGELRGEQPCPVCRKLVRVNLGSISGGTVKAHSGSERVGKRCRSWTVCRMNEECPNPGHRIYCQQFDCGGKPHMADPECGGRTKWRTDTKEEQELEDVMQGLRRVGEQW